MHSVLCNGILSLGDDFFALFLGWGVSLIVFVMSLRAMKSLARTPPGQLKVIKQDFGEENRVTATYLPLHFKMGDLGSTLDLDDSLDKVTSYMDCLDGRSSGGRTDLSCLKPFHPCPAVSSPMGQLSVSRLGFGEDKRSVVYSPGNFLGDRDLPVLNPHYRGMSRK